MLSGQRQQQHHKHYNIIIPEHVHHKHDNIIVPEHVYMNMTFDEHVYFPWHSMALVDPFADMSHPYGWNIDTVQYLMSPCNEPPTAAEH